MSNIRGVKHFSDFFKDFETDYVIIGGVAASIIFEDNDLSFRATKDVDMVILTNNSITLNKKIAEYIRIGGFETKEASKNDPRYYRFSKPENKEFPEIIEIFARNENKLELEEGQYIIPVNNDEVEKLSAILLDDEYFNLIKDNVHKNENGYSIITPLATICLKARAYREMNERKKKDEKIDSKDIRKHRNDIIKLTVVLEEGNVLKLSKQASGDMKNIIQELDTIDPSSYRQIMKGYPPITLKEIVSKLESSFVFEA